MEDCGDDLADDLFYNDDGADDPHATPVAEHGDPLPAQPLRSDDAMSFTCEPCDARVPITLRSPMKPSKEDVEKHCATHLPYRNWCPVCVKAKGREDAHARSSDDEKPGLPVVSMDYSELDDKKDSRSNKTLVVKDESSGAVLQYKVTAKGPTDDWVVKRLVKDVEEFGRKDIRLKTDGEPAIVALQSKVAATRDARTIPMNPPAYNPQANGSCEKGVQDTAAETRALKLGLENRLGIELKDEDKIMEWIYVHAAFLVTRYQLGHDGMTPWERLTGRTWHRPAVEMGETVLAKLATQRGGKMQTKQKKKLAARSIRAVVVGQVSRTGEHIVVGESGDAVRCRTIFRVPEDERWNKDLVLAIKGTPRAPAPSKLRSEKLDAPLVDDVDQKPRPQQRHAPRPAGEREEGSGVGLGQPEVRGPRVFEPRRFRITDRILEKYGYSDHCKGCDAKRHGLPAELAGGREHSQQCRQRLTDLMQENEADKELIQKDEDKFGAEASRAQNQQRDSLPDQARHPVDDLPHGRDAGMDVAVNFDPSHQDRDVKDKVQDTVEAVTADDCAVDADNDPDGIPQLNEDALVENNIESENDAPMEFEDFMKDDEPNAKRQRLERLNLEKSDANHLLHKAPLATRAGRTMAGQPNNEDIAEDNLAHLNSLTKVRNRSDVKQLIKELEELQKFKLPNMRRARRSMRAQGKNDVSEIYSPPRIAEAADAIGLKGGWSLDLTTVDENGEHWDFTREDMRKRARARLKADEPFMLIASPMCGPFSELQSLFNYPGMNAADVKQKLENGLEHIKFCIELCIEQHQHGRAFLLEHPAGSLMWATDMMAQLKRLSGVDAITFDFCMLGMTVEDKSGDKQPVQKKTTVITNSPSVQLLLREAKCRREHRHAHLLNGTAKACEIYPKKFCRLICEGVKRDMDNLKWRDERAKIFDITQPMGKLMALQEQAERLAKLEQCCKGAGACPPEEDVFAQIYDGLDFVDDVSGEPLDKKEAIKARRVEMQYFRDKGVYTKVRRQPWMKVISTRWLDINKGDAANRNYRARLVGREIKKYHRDDLFAATPPLESLKLILSKCAAHQHFREAADNYIVMTNDVKRAYFNAAATRPIFIIIPQEDREEGDEEMVGQLNVSLYGTRDAAQNWSRTVTRTMVALGFEPGQHSPCNFKHPTRGVATTVHGDDFTSTGRESDLRWLDNELKKRFELKTEFLGPDVRRHVQQVRVLNRVISWSEESLTYEADQRHAEILIRELGLQDARPVATPGARDEANKASQVEVNAHGSIVTKEDDQNNPPLKSEEATKFRALTARANYLAQDRPEAQYAIKEIARRMATPRVNDWLLLKRLGRYLLGTPRVLFQYYWQHTPTYIDVFVDSDWAGCKGSCRSTTGGAIKLGYHTIKTWSTTQAVIALSSGEAELYALTRGATNAIGMVSLMADFGIDVHLKIHTDSSAAIGIVSRQGVGKLRHVRVQYLWIQSRVQDGELSIHKVAGKENPADLLTKNVTTAEADKYLEALCIERSTDRAAIAPTLSCCNHHNDDHHDQWQVGDREAVRRHEKSRKELFTPLGVAGAPPANGLTPVRITNGVFSDGEAFEIIDTWTARPTAHRALDKYWTGTTRFLLRSER